MMADALELLKEQQKEIKELKVELNDVYEHGCTFGC